MQSLLTCALIAWIRGNNTYYLFLGPDDDIMDTEKIMTNKEELTKIAALRDILFGENMSQYSKEFRELRDTIEQTKKELEGQIDKLQKELSKKDDALANSMAERRKLARMFRKVADDLEK